MVILQFSRCLRGCLFCLLLMGPTLAKAQYSDDFKKFLALFRPIQLPISTDGVYHILDQQSPLFIPEKYAVKIIGEPYNFTAVGEIKQSSPNKWLLVTVSGRAHSYILIFNQQGRLLQKLDFFSNPPLSYGRILTGQIYKDLSVKLEENFFSKETQQESTAHTLYKKNTYGTLRFASGTPGRLLELSPKYLMSLRVALYYQSLVEGSRMQFKTYENIGHLFAPKIRRWLGMVNTNGTTIAKEAARFLNSKKDVFYRFDGFKPIIKGNVFTIPVKLRWQGYQAKVRAQFIFNQHFEIVSLTETPIK